MANGGLTQEEADLRAVKMAVKRGPEQAVDQMMSMLARSVAGIAGIEASISQATAAARLARGMPERAATPQPVEEERVAPPVVRSPALPISPRVRPWTDAPAASPDAPGGMSLQRLLVSGDRDQVAAGPRQEDAASDALWPTISVAQIVSLMQGVRFFREADLPPECHAEVAGWFDQCHFDSYRVLSAEGGPCHTFCLLAHGTAEAIEAAEAGLHGGAEGGQRQGQGQGQGQAARKGRRARRGATLEAGAHWGD